MTIITQEYNLLIEKLIKNNLKKIMINLKLQENDTVYNYINILSNFDDALNKSFAILFKEYLEQLDKDFCNSKERKNKYDIKDYCSRTILTIFGEITFNRYFYKSKLTGSSYCFLDRKLGLKKYQYFDPWIRSLIVSKVSETSISEACKQINEMIGKRVNLNNKTKFLSRQSARNIILESILAEDVDEVLETPEEIYIIADEKFIATQNNPSKTKNSTKEMVKSIVVYDGYTKVNKRRILQNKRVFSTRKENIITQSLDYINNVYDVDQIKRVFVMGDGAKWIKALTQHYKFNSYTKVYYCLDKFHFKQALHHLVMDKKLENKCVNYIINNDKDSFNKIVYFIKNNNPKRKEKIEEKYKYIINNWKDIKRLYKYKMSCPMESQISHNIAALTTSRPKGYSIEMLDKIIKLRMLKINNKNIQNLYIQNYNNNKPLKLNIININFSFFEKTNNFVPIYHGKLFNPGIGKLY